MGGNPFIVPGSTPGQGNIMPGSVPGLSNNGYDPLSNLSLDQINAIKTKSMKLAKVLMDENDKDLIDIAIHSKDFQHRIAAAWHFGLAKKIDDCLFKLLTDEHPLVSFAARESCKSIASKKFGARNVDFGPEANASQEHKNDAAELWRVYFDKKIKSTPVKPVPLSPKEKTTAEILGLPKDN